MLLQALLVAIEMKNLNLGVTLLVQKGVGTRSHTKKRCGNGVPTRSHPTTPLGMWHEQARVYRECVAAKKRFTRSECC